MPQLERSRGFQILTVSLVAPLLILACGGAETPDVAPQEEEAASAPDPDVYLAPLTGSGSDLRIGPITNVSDRLGYDNQPAFTPDGAALLYTAADGAGQADIMRYDLESQTAALLTQTFPESEYSATPIPDGSGFSAIRVEADSTQRLWRFDWEGTAVGPVLPDVAPAGYHAWSGMDHIALFVLGDPPTLEVVAPGPGRGAVADSAIGRSLQPIPGTGKISYVRRSGEAGMVMALNPSTGEVRPIGPTLGSGQDHGWTPAGDLLMGNGGVIHRWDPEREDWSPVAMELAFEGGISRLAVSPDGSLLAFVGSR
ncbi:MAG: hypothetical protein HKO53_15090 [Gemmatimonadetes bacterium]|nr:hypothetical protein [Gemmatimonadota bacterium]